MYEISGNFGGKFRENFRKFLRRKISGENFPGNFPPDFPGFSGDETPVTALILSFKKLKIKKTLGNFGRTFSGNSGKFFPKTTRNFLRIFLRFFNWNVLSQPWFCLFKNIKIHEISGNFGGKFRENFRKFLRRKISGGNFPGNFPRDFPGFSGDKTPVTALNLSF